MENTKIICTRVLLNKNEEINLECEKKGIEMSEYLRRRIGAKKDLEMVKRRLRMIDMFSPIDSEDNQYLAKRNLDAIKRLVNRASN